MSLFHPVKAIGRDGLTNIVDEIHDAYIDLDQLSTSGAVVSVPLSRGQSRKRRIGWTSTLGDNPTWDADLVISGVADVSIEHDQGLGTYTVNRLSLDESTGAVTLDFNEAASLVLRTDGTGVEIRVMPR